MGQDLSQTVNLAKRCTSPQTRASGVALVSKSIFFGPEPGLREQIWFGVSGGGTSLPSPATQNHGFALQEGGGKPPLRHKTMVLRCRKVTARPTLSNTRSDPKWLSKMSRLQKSNYFFSASGEQPIPLQLGGRCLDFLLLLFDYAI